MKSENAVKQRYTTRMPRRSWAVALLAALLALTLLPGAADAQQDDKSEAEVKAFSRQKEERPAAEAKKGPGFKGKSDEIELPAVAQQKRDEAIRLLTELAQSTPDSDAEKPQFLFQLAEMLWSKSKYYEQQAFKTQDDMYKADDAKDRARVDQLKRKMQSELEESKKLREQAVQVYVQIIKSFDSFDQLDNVYFFLGVNLLEIGKRPQALQIFREMIKKYPESRYIPNVLLAFGEYYFDNDDMEQALKAYEKVLSFKDSNIRTYAMYKLAWCHYNQADYDQAMSTFLDVVKETEKGRAATDKSLRKEALRDIVLTYSQIGKASKAMEFFGKVVKSQGDVLFMGERLAQLFAEQGQLQESTNLFHKLIDLNRTSFKVMDYQLEIVRNVEALGIQRETVKEVLRSMALFEHARKFKDADGAQVTSVETNLEQILREYATNYHRQAQKTRNEETYALAYELYKVYIESFPQSKDLYIMTFFYAELLYRLQKYDEATVMYEKVIELDPKGEYSKEAIHAVVLSGQKAVKVEEVLSTTDKSINTSANDDKPKGIPTPKTLTPAAASFVRACERYMEINPDGKDIVKVMYSRARLLYDYDHLQEAIPVFQLITKKYPDDRLAVIAADLHLDSLYLLNDFDALEQAVTVYRANDKLAVGEFKGRLDLLAEQTSFKKCNILEDKKEYDVAAVCFTDFYKAFPESEYVDKALYNAALDYERVNELGKAIQVRKGLLQLRPNSDLAPITLFNIGGNYHALAVYSEASKFYELFVQYFPEHEKTEEALANAATFRQGLGQNDEAINNYKKYLELFPQKKEQCAEVFFQIAAVLDESGRKKDAVGVYEDYLKKWAKVGKKDRELEANVKIGLAQWEARSENKAIDLFNKTLKIYSGLRDEQRSTLTTGRDAAAQARFMVGEARTRELQKIKLKLPEKALQKSLVEKIKGYEEARQIYFDVFNFQRPDWTIAALYRIGFLFQDFANEIRNSPVPTGLTEDQIEIYKGGLEEKASQIEGGAVESYQKCLETALQASWFNQYSKKCEVELANLKPREYRKPSELRAEPNASREGYAPAGFSDEALTRDLGLSEEAEK